ncbi:MAG: 4Fe-4S binding protein [Caldilineaceae bacterium]
MAQTAFCVNRRYEYAGCTLCVESCPTGAIEQNGGELLHTAWFTTANVAHGGQL